MNEPFGVERDAALLDIMVRADALRRGEMWSVALAHLSLLTVAFLIILIVTDAISRLWPAVPILEGFELDLARLMLVLMAAWIFVSGWRRSAATRAIEYQFLRDEIREIRERLTYSG